MEFVDHFGGNPATCFGRHDIAVCAASGSSLVLCIAYAEYVRLGMREDALYKECLTMLLDVAEMPGKRNTFKDVLILALECFSDVCKGAGDVRTGILLEEKKKTLEQERKDGIFL